MGKRSNFERRERDFYPTPYKAVVPLIPHLGNLTRFDEPCCGDGELIRHLESFGLKCGYRGDIATGQDALLVERFDEPVITNTPWLRPVLHALIAHFIRAAPFAWLAIDSDWKETKQSIPFMRHCTHVLPIGRVKWIPNSRGNGKDNAAWYRFDGAHKDGPVLLPYRAAVPGHRQPRCMQCGASYQPQRSDSRFCSDACRQRAYRERLAVTQA